MKKVLVTGGGGFIGRAVVKALKDQCFSIKVFDLIKTDIVGVEESYIGTILDPHELARAVRGCDYVMHLAASLGVQHTELNRLECLHINIQGTINVLEASIKEGVKKIVFSSSSEVYGDQKETSISEDAPLNPKSNYAISKLAGEEYLRAYSKTYGLKYNICRLFNVYGENQREEFVLPIFLKNAFNRNALRIYGDGNQVRSFCYVSDAAKGLVSALLDGNPGEIYNIGNNTEPIAVKHLAKKIIDLSGFDVESKNVTYSNSDRDIKREIFNRVPDIRKAKNHFGYHPTVSLDEGIKKLIHFHNEK